MESTLPLNILSFKARKKGPEAYLEWIVNKAVNTSHFEIERSDEKDFVYIGKVESINEWEELKYSFTDERPLKGWNYYRLKQIDLDNHFQYSAVRSLNFSEERSISVYPNPSTEQIRIDGNLDVDASFMMYNAEGELVKAGKVIANSAIEVSELLSGAYHFILRNGVKSSSFLIIKI